MSHALWHIQSFGSLSMSGDLRIIMVIEKFCLLQNFHSRFLILLLDSCPLTTHLSSKQEQRQQNSTRATDETSSTKARQPRTFPFVTIIQLCIQLSDQSLNLFCSQTKDMQEVQETLPIQPSFSLHLNKRLSIPSYSQPSLFHH